MVYAAEFGHCTSNIISFYVGPQKFWQHWHTHAAVNTVFTIVLTNSPWPCHFLCWLSSMDNCFN